MKEKPLVSVLISYYNDHAFLRSAIDSILNSSYTNFELFLVNHATTDDCREIAHSYTDSRIIHMDMPYNITVGGTGWIVGEFLKKAKGKYIKLFCADDMLRKDGLELLVDYMEKHPEKDFAFGNMNYVDENGKDLNANHFDVRDGFSRNLDEVEALKLYSMGLSVFPYPSSIIKRDTLKCIKLNKAIAMTFDMSIWMMLLCKGFKFGLLDQCIVNYRISENQASALGKLEQARVFGYFEWGQLWKIFQSIEDVSLVKKLFPNSELINKLNSVDDIPFYIATIFFQKTDVPTQQVAYDYISDLLNDDIKRQYLETKFGYTIKNLRMGCLKPNHNSNAKELNSSYSLKKYKTKLYSKSPRDLNILEIMFLLFRKILMSLNIIKTVKHLSKKKKQYNV